MGTNRAWDDRPAILHVVNTLEGGGTERTLLAILQRLEHREVRHAVVTLRHAGALSGALPDSVACCALNHAGCSRFAGVHLAGVARGWRAKLIHARNTGCWTDAVVAGMLSRAQVILGFHGLEHDGRISGRHRRTARVASALGARFTAVSAAGRRQLHHETGVSLGRIDMLPNGVQNDRFVQRTRQQRRAIRAALGLQTTDCVVGIVGALTPVKRHDLLISASARVSQTVAGLRLLIVGDGPLRATLARQATEAGVGGRVHFTGWRDDLPALLSAMDIYVCSSAAEGMSNALLEAMASGLSVVTTDVGDHARIVRHARDGLVTRPDSVEELAAAIEKLAADPTLRLRLARTARERVRAFSFDKTVRAYADYYRARLAPCGGSPGPPARTGLERLVPV